jgi:spore coat polysaccharide biosynthesis protein SpsF
MRTVAVIQARMGSTRLPGKILKEVAGRPLLDYMLERVRRAKSLDAVLIATTTSPQDDVLERFCRERGVLCHRGSEDDVLDRYYGAARAADAGTVVRLTSDCPVMDPRVIDDVVGEFRQSGCDYVANTAPPPTTYPDGMDVEVFSFAALERAWKEAQKPSEREHVTFYFWKNPGLFKTRRRELPEDLSRFRLTLDYPQDLELLSRLLAELYPGNPAFSMADAVDFLRKNPQLHAINADIVPNQGWIPSLEKDKRQAGG